MRNKSLGLLAAAVSVGLLGALAGPSAAQQRRAASSVVQLEGCLVVLIEEADVPAQQAGVITEITVHEGDQVEVDQQLAQIDDAQVQVDREVKEQERLIAETEASNDIDIRYAVAAAQVAEKVYELSVEANRRSPGSKPQTELQRLALEHRRAELAIEQARHDHSVQVQTERARAAEVRAVDVQIEQRRVRSPLPGVVVEVLKHRGEWAAPGDPIVRVVRLDRLKITGTLDFAEYAPQDVQGRSVLVTAQLSAGRVATFEGRVTFVDPEVDTGGHYEVCAEVDNQAEAGEWLLRPGLRVTLEIDLSSAPQVGSEVGSREEPSMR